MICDVRIRPYSKREEWNGDALTATFNKPGKRPLYRHIPELGNPHRFEGANSESGELAVCDLDAGIGILRALSEQGRTPLLLCACSRHADCHRSLITAALIKRGFTVKPLYWRANERRDAMDADGIALVAVRPAGD